MHINELGTDVLTCVLSTACQAEQVAYLDEEKAEGLRAALAVCRLWRELMLPYAYRHLRLAYDSLDVENTEVQRIDKGFARYVRTIDISICGLIIESFDIVAYLNDTGVGSDAWPRVTKIHIFNDIKLGKSRKRKEDYKVKPSASTTEAAGDYMRRLFPNITEIKYINVDGRYNNSANLKRTKYLFFQELIHGYSKQLRALNQRVYGRSLPRDLAFPQQLTHLTISMIDYECEVLPKMLAPSLRHLKIADATPDITWNWFSSNDGDDIWFTSLRDLLIEFQRSSFRATYLAHDLPKFKSDNES
ncbi:hypothetical protein GGI12_003942 [Dipsacomyces acuminosporus]|nr:hypothetical protein GGI12_003942 [Dipsacomyces acuminosporus]